MKDFKTLAKNRRSVHQFLPEQKVSDEIFAKILESVRYTPSGYNAQPWDFILIRDEKRLKKLSDIAFGQKHLIEAGNAVIVISNTEFGRDEHERITEEWKIFAKFSDKQIISLRDSLIGTKRDKNKKQEMALRNASLAAMNFMLSAEDLGWATCPMMGIRQREALDFVKAPEDYIFVMLFALGKADTEKISRKFPRKKVEAFGWRESFQER